MLERRGVERFLFHRRQSGDEDGVLQLEALDLVRRDERLITHAARAVDGEREQEEVGRARGRPCAGLECRRQVSHEREDFAGLVVARGIEPRLRRVVRHARRMCDQLPHGHRLPRRRQILHVLSDRIVQAEFLASTSCMIATAV